jgi:lactate permease
MAALVIPLVGLFFIFPKRQIKANLGFIYLSVLSCVLPYVAVSAWNCEFPSIVGGLIGTVLSVFFAHKGIGLAKENIAFGEVHTKYVSLRRLLKASFPLWGTVLVLLVTRIDCLGIKAILNADTPAFKISLGKIGILNISAALSITLKNILGTSTSWNHKFLYIPSIIPFFVVGFISFRIFCTSKADIATAWNESLHRMRYPAIALLGTLVFTRLFMYGGESSCTMIIGKALANAAGRHWYWFAPLLGALGSFFAGSNTVSNLTFAPIQNSIGQTLCLNMTVVLALQSVGGAFGKMICIHDIVSGCSVIGIIGLEGRILKRTVIPMLLYAIITAMCVPLLLMIL